MPRQYQRVYKLCRLILTPQAPSLRVHSRYSTEGGCCGRRTTVRTRPAPRQPRPLPRPPYVVSEGKSWGRHRLRDGSEHFFRSSEQLGWITEERGTVLEEVLVDHAGQRILFLGREFLKRDGERLRTGNFQPLFHVEHAVGGSRNNPLNMWRIVILTPERDERYTEPFKEMTRQGLLPGFLEIYIERRFHCDLKRREA